MVIQDVASGLLGAALVDTGLVTRALTEAGFYITSPPELKLIEEAVGFQLAVEPGKSHEARQVALSAGILRPFYIFEKKKTWKQRVVDLWQKVG
ncbi:MAG: hypothetical protein L0Y56_06145 [Nitrospira sp.]|nr:hypothetical protein [Nitrospira sp.]